MVIRTLRRMLRTSPPRTERPAGTSRPAFLVGNGRSGTSMLVHRLERSPQVRLYNEDHPDAFEDFHLREFEAIRELVAGSPAAVTLFKPIKDTYLTAALLAAFPHSQVLFLYRHFDDVINSARRFFFERRARRTGQSLESMVPPVDIWMATDFGPYAAAPPPRVTRTCIRDLWRQDLNLESKIALHWLFQNSLYFDLGLHEHRRVRLVNYEAMIRNPEPVMGQICSFLQIGYQPDMITGLHASSIGRRPAPQLDDRIRLACAGLHQQLQQARMAGAA